MTVSLSWEPYIPAHTCAWQPARLPCQLSKHFPAQSSTAALQQQLEGIVKAAGERPPSGGGTVTRIDLRRSALAQNPMVSEGLHDLAEE